MSNFRCLPPHLTLVNWPITWIQRSVLVSSTCLITIAFVFFFYKVRLCVFLIFFFMYDVFCPRVASPSTIKPIGSCCVLLDQMFVTRGLTLAKEMCWRESFPGLLPFFTQSSVVFSFHKGWRQSHAAAAATPHIKTSLFPVALGLMLTKTHTMVASSSMNPSM